MSTGKTRPTGVTIISILAIIVGVSLLAAGIAIAAFSSMFTSIGMGVGGLLSTLGYIIGGVVLFFGLIWTLTGWGLLSAKGWARTLALIFSILSLIGTIFIAASGSITGIAACAIWILMLYYLFTPPVKTFFGGAPSFNSSGGSTGSPALGTPSIPTSFSNPLGRSSFGSGTSGSSTSNTSASGSSSYSGNRFCSNCGSTLSPSSNKCPSCGTTN